MIITNLTDVKLSVKIPHFYKNDFLGIALEDSESYNIGEIIKEIVKTENVNIEDYTHYDFIDFLLKHNIHTFKVWHYSDFAEIPMEFYDFTVKNRKILMDSIMSSSVKFSDIYHKRFDGIYRDKLDDKLIDGYFFLFHNYDDCLRQYKNISNQ